MAIPYREFIHPNDKKALDALRAIPGLDIVMKKIIALIREKMFKVEVTSSYLKLGPDQMPHIYNMVVECCEKLQIDVPEVYVKLDRSVNAFTLGDTDIFIVIHSGLLETLSEEEVKTVIAHECGHIVCRHNLYTTVAMILKEFGTALIAGLVSAAVILAIEAGFAYWQRCSEFSADRVAAYVMNDPKAVVNMTMAFAGGYKGLPYDANMEAFLRQADDYHELVTNSAYNKFLELIQFLMIDHPLNANRARECMKFWDEFNVKLYNKQVEEEKLKALTTGEIAKSNVEVYYNARRAGGISALASKLRNVSNNDNLNVDFDGIIFDLKRGESWNQKMNNGKYLITFRASNRRVEYELDLKEDTKIVVEWSDQEETILVKEEKL